MIRAVQPYKILKQLQLCLKVGGSEHLFVLVSLGLLVLGALGVG